MADVTDHSPLTNQDDFTTPDTPDNVITIGNLQLRRLRNHERSAQSACPHRRLSIESDGEIVRCRDCKAQVTAYWALSYLAQEFEEARRRINADREQLAADAKKYVVLKAAKRIEGAWRNGMSPSCPHCGLAVLPEDNMGASAINVEFERKKRARRDAVQAAFTADEAVQSLSTHLRAGGTIVAPLRYAARAITVSPCGTGFYAMGEARPHATPEAAIMAACERWGLDTRQFTRMEYDAPDAPVGEIAG